MEAPATLLAELKRRRVIRALVGYGIAAFAVLQIIEPVMHGLHWPDEVLICIGALAAAPGLFWYFVLPGRARVAAAAAPSIAVLPFVDMSPGKDQEYFSDGVAEEILDALAHIDGLHVAGRTSSFSFKGKGDDLRSIGEKLNVANILEGSVRKEGNRVRITAQLVNAGTGFHVWSETYDRELAGVFSAQDEIARAVVAALKVKLLAARAAIDEQRTASAEAHDQYLSGRHFYERGSAEGYDRAVQALEKAVALDPGYAPAWAALSLAHFNAYDRIPSRHNAQEMLRARAAADKAIALAPDFAGGYSARGNLRVNWDYDWSGARADLERALSLNPGDTDVLTSYAWLLSTLGLRRAPLARTAARTRLPSSGRAAKLLRPRRGLGQHSQSFHFSRERGAIPRFDPTLRPPFVDAEVTSPVDAPAGMHRRLDLQVEPGVFAISAAPPAISRTPGRRSRTSRWRT